MAEPSNLFLMSSPRSRFLWLHLMRIPELNRRFAFKGASPLIAACASALFFLVKRESAGRFFSIARGVTSVAAGPAHTQDL